MKIAIVDISGKVIKYDIALCNALNQYKQKGINIEFYCPLYDELPSCETKRLINIIPSRYKNSESLFKRSVKLLEVVMNYFIVIWESFRKKPDILHFQWFPLLEKTSIERLAVRLIRMLSPKTRVFLTIHNVYPHDIIGGKKEKYVSRFNKIAQLIDGFVVHTNITKGEVCSDFNIVTSKVHVIHHGIFIPEDYEPRTSVFDGKQFNIIIFGNLSKYKGVDVLVEAMGLLPVSYKNRIHAVIAGEIQDKSFCAKLQKESKELNIDWFTYFLPEKELYTRIESANAIILPYRHISQSGVLLLALSFRRLIITSDLPSFKETLQGFTDDMFFQTGNPQSLAQLMMRYVDGEVDVSGQMKVIERLDQQYSWEKAAEITIQTYQQAI